MPANGTPPLTRRRNNVLKNNSFTPSDDQINDARQYLLAHLQQEEMNPAALAAGGRSKVLELLRAAINEGRIAGVGKNPPESVIKGLYEHTLGLGIIEVLLANPTVEQINLLGPKNILVQSNGTWGKINDATLLFQDEREYRRVISNLVRRVGKELSPHTHPIMDIRFDNPVLRIHINQTVRGGGLAVYIRRGRSAPFKVEKLLKAGNFDRPVANLLIEAAQRLIGCIFIGPVGTGKTVMLEMYIDHMPNVPIVVADDAGDCTPSHPFCIVNDLPGTAYSIYDKQIITLGGLVKAALREGDVIAVAEVRGSEEAGITISNAPRMRSIVTTFHGESPEAGLSSLVSVAQTPPSPYAGMEADALAQSIATAFPLVVQMERSGDKRFVSGMYFNRARKNGEWDLYPLATAVYHSSGEITWKVTGSLDDIQEERILDRIGRVRSRYETSDPRQLYTLALQDIEAKNWAAAKHHLYQCLLLEDTELARNQMVSVLEQTGEADNALAEAKKSAMLLQSLIDARNWEKARQLIDGINQRPMRVFMRRVMPKYPNLLPLIDQGTRETEHATNLLQTADSLIGTQTRWDIIEMMVDQISSLNQDVLNKDLLGKLYAVRAQLLAHLVENAPIISQDYFQQLQARSTV